MVSTIELLLSNPVWDDTLWSLGFFFAKCSILKVKSCLTLPTLGCTQRKSTELCKIELQLVHAWVERGTEENWLVRNYSSWPKTLKLPRDVAGIAVLYLPSAQKAKYSWRVGTDLKSPATLEYPSRWFSISMLSMLVYCFTRMCNLEKYICDMWLIKLPFWMSQYPIMPIQLVSKPQP